MFFKGIPALFVHLVNFKITQKTLENLNLDNYQSFGKSSFVLRVYSKERHSLQWVSFFRGLSDLENITKA